MLMLRVRRGMQQQPSEYAAWLQHGHHARDGLHRYALLLADGCVKQGTRLIRGS